ncbi:PREDICTED: methyltransferase-like protein 9 [Nicrophorus vespilloides]|uniref:Methyltransferase-like protein 9 n=1 Tax=Nicrophorus vespilloides TaxID=110193 RepID=A0ABM1MGS8_NICVS|nr:PREDICTED: methyltransferase-like protein 9 [Nicrophorus vespilloides]
MVRWLQRGSMFVVSFQQFLKLVGGGEDWSTGDLLDLGAGDGEVTALLAPAFRTVYVTEVSNTMQTLLQRRGFHLLGIDEWNVGRKYDVISCLNLLDRCDKPLELLNQVHASLKPNGMVLLAVVLPFSPYVESAADHEPTERLNIRGQTFEDQVVHLVDNVLRPVGFEVISWSRVPYLCEGDLRQSYYWLDESIFVLKAV